jgi:transcriptional regulator with XRE-family HTH domain
MAIDNLRVIRVKAGLSLREMSARVGKSRAHLSAVETGQRPVTEWLVSAYRIVRWAAVEAVQRIHTGPLARTVAMVGARRGRNIAKVAAARELLTLVFYALRDGHVRCLAKAAA